jgi:protein-S-isoprenylcysteine O-methyltransferase Ste14
VRDTRWSTTAFAVTSALVLTCFAAAAACLWQWGQPAGWARIDRFSGGALLVYALILLQHVRLYSRLAFSRVPRKEVFGASYDPLMGLFNAVLLLGQLTVFLDYGHWHLTPRLERAGLQYAGLGLYAISLTLVVWADRHLIREFTAPRTERRVITTGPYRYLRHPRYAGLFLTNIALALTFASGLGWVFAAAWMVVVWRRIYIEERHLCDLFGAEYARYAERTGVLFPIP